jgi:hypothetical protein
LTPSALWFDRQVLAHQVVDEFLKRHGNEDGGSYFLGSTYSAAETLTTPWLVCSFFSSLIAGFWFHLIYCSKFLQRYLACLNTWFLDAGS